MLQTLYFHVLRRIPDETLTFCIKNGRKNTPPPKPYFPGNKMQYFLIIFVLLGAGNVSF